MWRYDFTKANVEKAKRFLKGTIKTGPSFLSKYKGTIKKGKLHLEGRLVVPREEETDYLRKKVLAGRVPLARDSLYYFLSKSTVGVTRSGIEKFLKAQNVIRETDNLQPSTKKASRRVLKKGQIEFDLVEINWDDLKFRPTDKNIGQRNSGYIFTVAEQLTGLLWAKFAPSKAPTDVTPIAKEAFAYMAEKLKIPLTAMHGTSDSGSEFNFKLYKQWGLRTKQVARGPLIEQKNSQLQRQLFRVAKFKNTKNLAKLIKDSTDICNRTQSSITKVAPFEALEMPLAELVRRYNKKRGAGSGGKIRARPLKIGEFVRLVLLKDKEKKNYTFHKAYKGVSYSKQRYKVLQKRGSRYKIDGPSGKKFYHRDDLRITSESDKRSLRILHDRKVKLRDNEAAERKKIRAEIDKAKKGKKQRKAAVKGMKKFREMADREKELDVALGV